MTRLNKDGFGIYIHVPFCKSKCPYCDFYSLSSLGKAEDYTKAVTEELETLRRSKAFTGGDIYDREVTGLYFGGGTPSHLGSERLCRILNAVKRKFSLAEDAEITVECNPSDGDMLRFFESVKQAGVNRISLGMQSAVDSERRALGRTAGADRVREVIEEAKLAGIDNISVDLMIGIPRQTMESLKESLDFTLSLPVTHLSVYILKIEEGTFFYKKKDSLPLPDEDTVADMYLFMCDYLKKKGMRHYEISNFCFGDKSSRHNTLYWQLKDYWGIGPGAHSFINGRRFYFDRDLDGFIKGEKPTDDGMGGGYDEKLMLALRLDGGIRTDDWYKNYHTEKNEKTETFLRECEKNGLARYENGIFSLTDRGMLMSNAVICKILMLNEL